MTVNDQHTEQKSSKWIHLLFGASMLVVLALLAFTTEWMRASFPIPFYKYALRLLVVLSGVTILFYWMGRLVLRERIPERLKNLMTGSFSLLIILLLAEATFTLIPRTFGKGIALAERNWFNYYWETNSYGYRDLPIQNDHDLKQKVVLLGDSFVAGHGIKDPQDRCSNRLATLLGEDFQVFNLGKNGSDTQEQYQNLVDFPLIPDILVLCHMTNDIDRLAKENGISRKNIPGIHTYKLDAIWPVRYSFLGNYIYYKFEKLFRSGNTLPEGYLPPSMQFMQDAYCDPVVFDLHRKRLQLIVDYCTRRNVRLLVVLFPNLNDKGMEYAAKEIHPVLKAYFEEHNLPVTDVYELVKHMPLADRIVNHNDRHPSVRLNALLATHLKARFEDLGWLEPAH